MSDQNANPSIRYIIIMGVSGCGKSTVGAQTAERLNVPFLDGDDYHPPANKQKMGNGQPLTDDDRWPWLETLARAMSEASDAPVRCVAACSSLKRTYRDFLQSHLQQSALFVHLDGDKQTILDRMNKRNHEYMPTSLLDSQFATLEPLGKDEKALIQSLNDDVQTIVKNVESALKD